MPRLREAAGRRERDAKRQPLVVGGASLHIDPVGATGLQAAPRRPS